MEPILSPTSRASWPLALLPTCACQQRCGLLERNAPHLLKACSDQPPDHRAAMRRAKRVQRKVPWPQQSTAAGTLPRCQDAFVARQPVAEAVLKLR
jgi:hypothetical protein